MAFWVAFWGILLAVSLAIFAGLAVVIAVGGFFDVKALFKSIDAQHAKERPAQDPTPTPPEG